MDNNKIDAMWTKTMKFSIESISREWQQKKLHDCIFRRLVWRVYVCAEVWTWSKFSFSQIHSGSTHPFPFECMSFIMSERDSNISQFDRNRNNILASIVYSVDVPSIRWPRDRMQIMCEAANFGKKSIAVSAQWRLSCVSCRLYGP